MKKSVVFAAFVSLLLLIGCGHVSQGELEKSQTQLKADLEQDASDKSLAVLDCIQTQSLVQRAWLICQTNGTYCNVVEVYKSYCHRTDETTEERLAPKPGVVEAMDEAAREENSRLENQ